MEYEFEMGVYIHEIAREKCGRHIVVERAASVVGAAAALTLDNYFSLVLVGSVVRRALRMVVVCCAPSLVVANSCFAFVVLYTLPLVALK